MMSNEDMLSTRTTTTTDCCQLIRVEIMKNVLIKSELPHNRFIVASTDMKFPEQVANVEVVVFAKGAMFASETCELSPRYITLRMGSNTIGASLSNCPLGEYTVSIRVDEERYTAVLSRGFEFKVVSEFSSVPAMKSAFFSDDFTSLAVNFDVPTTKSGIFP